MSNRSYVFLDYLMSTSFMIFHNGFEMNQEFYPCPDVISVALKPTRPYWGIYFFTVGLLILILYIPCLFAIASSDLMRTPAYKTMLILSIYDISSTFAHSIATGVLGFFGYTFCDYPRLIFILGSVALGSWMGCCITSMTLAVIRICDISPQSKMKLLFSGGKIYVFLFFCIVYGLYAGLLTKPVTFTPVYMSWFFDPGLINNPEMYVNLAHTYNNIIMAICSCLFYTFLGYLIIKRTRGASVSNTLTKNHLTILLQTFLFCIFHTVASLLYVYMQFFSAPEYLILVSQVTWQMSSGTVCLVYLTLNKTLRKSVFRMFCPSFLYEGNNQISTYISGDSRARGLSLST